MTSKNSTPLLSLKQAAAPGDPVPAKERAFRFLFGAIQWPWLLRSLYGGSADSKRLLLERLELPASALPKLGSWKADTGLLHTIVDVVWEKQPRTVVELGSGASTLVAARALQQAGGEFTFHSFDQHANFVAAMDSWLAEHGLGCMLRHAPLVRSGGGWPGLWYDLPALTGEIDLLIIDGPPWTVHPFARGAADRLFASIAVGGTVLLDDAARPGERIVARRWARDWPDFEFRLDTRGTKGTLIGTRLR